MSGVSACHLLNGVFFYVTGITAVVADPLSFIVLLYVPSGSVRKDEVAASTT